MWGGGGGGCGCGCGCGWCGHSLFALAHPVHDSGRDRRFDVRSSRPTQRQGLGWCAFRQQHFNYIVDILYLYFIKNL